MESAKRACLFTLHGVKDCFSGIISLKDFIHAREQESNRENVQRQTVRRNDSAQDSVRNKLVQCLTFGVFFWASNVIFNYVFLQNIFHVFVEWTGEDLNSDRVVWLQRLLYCTFCVLWIFPLLFLSKILNFIWYQDIANLVLERSGIRRNADIRFSDFYADQIKSLILQMFYCFQGYAVYFLPLPTIVQNVWYLFHLALLSSLYAFEYKWVHMGLLLHRRLLNIDRKWPYYLGFGLPLAVITTYVSSFIDSMIIFATLFPIYVISSAVTFDNQSPVFSHPFHTFKIADFGSDMLIRFFMRMLTLPFLGR